LIKLHTKLEDFFEVFFEIGRSEIFDYEQLELLKNRIIDKADI